MIGLVKRPVSEHREENVTASPGERDEGLVVSFSLRDFPVIVGARDWVAERGKS